MSVTLLAVRPHPDDEVTGTGGLLAYYHERGIPVGVLTCTLGEEGEIRDPALNEDEARPRLGQIRERELRESCAVLGVDQLRLLGYRDSGMQGTEANNNPAAFWNAPLDESGERIAAVIRELRPKIVVTENEFGTYGHPDHVMCHRATVRGVQMAADPAVSAGGLPPWTVDRLFANGIAVDGRERLVEQLKAENLELGWFEHAGELPGAITVAEADAAVDVGRYAGVLREALRRHKTQITADDFLMTWPIHILAEAFRTAYFKLLHATNRAAIDGLRPLPDLLLGVPD